MINIIYEIVVIAVKPEGPGFSKELRVQLKCLLTAPHDLTEYASFFIRSLTGPNLLFGCGDPL
jgi:hypothetical protein